MTNNHMGLVMYEKYTVEKLLVLIGAKQDGKVDWKVIDKVEQLISSEASMSLSLSYISLLVNSASQ